MDLTASLSIMAVLVALMLILYYKIKLYYLILITFLFSLIIGGMAIAEGSIPFTPYTQLFFLTFMTVIFYLSSKEFYENKKGVW